MDARVISIERQTTIWSVKVGCPFCRKVHKHGGGYVTEKPNLGHRGSHCGLGSYTMKMGFSLTEASTPRLAV